MQNILGMNLPYRPVIIWLLTGCLLIFFMVIIGGITRLTHSGLSIVEWDLIMGTLPPLSKQDWLVLFEKYQQTPQYKQVNYHFSLEDFKSIFWWEYIHRLFGRMIGMVFIIPFLYFLFRKKLEKGLIKKLLIILLLGGFQGVLGWYMVKSGLVKNPAVSHYRLAAHLITAFAAFGYTFWVALELINGRNDRTKGKMSIHFLSWLFMIVLCTQIIYGAFVAGLRGGVGFPTFPKMGDEWIAEVVITDYNESGIASFFEQKYSVQFIHRCLAYVVLLLAASIYFKIRQSNINACLNRSGLILITVVIVQFLLGIFTLIYSVPLVLGVVHQAGALILFAATIYLLFHSRLSAAAANTQAI
jgi:cytochrome c oxidase assembly protein subunit 15